MSDSSIYLLLLLNTKAHFHANSIPYFQFNAIYLCAKLNSPEANYKVSTGKKMSRVRSKKVSENNVFIKIKIIKYKTMSTLLLS
jgi:hypothetical protein